MSGFDKKTGIFELNESKMAHYLRVEDKTIEDNTLSGFCTELFRRKGFQVIKRTIYGIHVVADDADVWEVLSGQPSTWGRSATPANDLFAVHCKMKGLDCDGRKLKKPRAKAKTGKPPAT